MEGGDIGDVAHPAARRDPVSIWAPIALIAAILAINAVCAGFAARRMGGWLFTFAGMIGLVALIGRGLNCRPAGILIDNRNVVSLSKLQALAWTLLILSAIVTITAAKLLDVAGAQGPISIDGDLLAAMGISATSLVATPAILSLKTTPGGESKVFDRTTPLLARWADLFCGDEVSNAATPDLSKIQQFFISLVVIGTYAFTVAKMMGSGGALAMPVLGQDMLWLLGISHAGYLGYKAVRHAPPAQGDGAIDPREAAAG